MSFLKRGVLAATVIFPVILAGCGVFSESKPPLPCPPVYVVKQAAFLTQYRQGTAKDVTDVVQRNRITDFRGECVYKRKNTRLTLTLSVVFDISRGPSNQDRRAQFSYFVAMPKFHPNPAGKRIFGVATRFEENQSRRLAADTVEIEVPIDPKTPLKEYAVYIGFQLTPAQLEDNRRRFDALQRR